MVVETELSREEYALENKDEPFPIDPLTRALRGRDIWKISISACLSKNQNLLSWIILFVPMYVLSVME